MANQSGTMVRIWDVWIRTFHWALAASIIFLLISGHFGFQFFEWHKTAGEFVLFLVVFRILWSFVGSSNATLLGLITNPLLALKHLNHLFRGNVEQERGHSAAGGFAVLAMLALVSFQAVSGMLIADEDELIEGAFYGLLNSDLSNKLLHLHHLNAKFLTALVMLHVVMVLMYLLRAKQNLITPMITGKLRWISNATPPSVSFGNNWIGLVLFATGLGFAAWYLGWL